jgi:hypothetical protein
MHKATSIADQDEVTGRLLQLQGDFASLVDKVQAVRENAQGEYRQLQACKKFTNSYCIPILGLYRCHQ